jgi:hypothetical protein
MATALNVKGNEKIAALSACITEAAEKAAKKELAPGKRSVDLLVHIQGELSKGEDQERRITARLPQKQMLLAAILLNGTCVEAFLQRYLAGEFKITEDQEKKLDEIWERLAETTVGTVSGSVRFNGTVDEITQV